MTLLITKSQFYELSELDEKGIPIWITHHYTLEDAEYSAKQINQEVIINLNK